MTNRSQTMIVAAIVVVALLLALLVIFPPVSTISSDHRDLINP